MVADSVLKTEEKFDFTGDNDNASVTVKQESIPDIVHNVAGEFIRHAEHTEVKLKSWGTPEQVYSQVRQDLINLGLTIGVAEMHARELVNYAIEQAESSRNNANIIGVQLVVSGEAPESMFRTGGRSTFRITTQSKQADVVGATSVAMGYGLNGTTVTDSTKDAVGNILQSMGNINVKSFWGDIFIPNQEELQGIANEAALSAMAQIAGGSLNPEQVEALLAEIQSYADMGLLAPEIFNVLQNMNQIQTLAAQGNYDGIKELSQAIIENLSAVLENGTASPEMIASALEAFQAISDTHGLKTVINTKGLMELKQDVQVAQLTEKLGLIAEGLEGIDKATLENLIEQLKEAEGTELLSHLDTIQQHLENIGIDENVLSVLTADIDSLKELVTQNLPLDQKLEVLAEIGAQDLMELLQHLDGLENLPPELSEILEQLDVENLTIEELKDALAGKGEPALVEAIQSCILALNNPDIQAALPQATLNQVNQFLVSQSALVDAVTAKAISNDLAIVVAALGDTPEAGKIQEVIDRLEAGESIDTIDPAIIEVVAEKLDNSIVAMLDTVVQNLQNATADNVTVGVDTRAELLDLIQSGDLDTSVVAKLEQAIEKGDLSLVIEAIAQDPQASVPILGKLIASAQALPIPEDQRTVINQIIDKVTADPTLLRDPDVITAIQAMVKGDIPATEISGKLIEAVFVAENGSKQVPIPASLPVEAVKQQISRIIESLPTGSDVSRTMTAALQPTLDILGKVGTATPPTAADMIKAVQNLNTVTALTAVSKNVSNAITGQLTAINKQFISTLQNTNKGFQKIIDRANPVSLVRDVAKTLPFVRPKNPPAPAQPKPVNKDPQPKRDPRNPERSKPKEPLVKFSDEGTTRVTAESRANEQAMAIDTLGGQEVKSLKDIFKTESTISAKIGATAEHGLKSIVKTFKRSCGDMPCEMCGACGTALKKVAATAPKLITGMKTILGLAPTNKQISDSLKKNVNIPKATNS
jgi:sugar phosphate isomerase/epimerase